MEVWHTWNWNAKFKISPTGPNCTYKRRGSGFPGVNTTQWNDRNHCTASAGAKYQRIAIRNAHPSCTLLDTSTSGFGLSGENWVCTMGSIPILSLVEERIVDRWCRSRCSYHNSPLLMHDVWRMCVLKSNPAVNHNRLTSFRRSSLLYSFWFRRSSWSSSPCWSK